MPKSQQTVADLAPEIRDLLSKAEEKVVAALAASQHENELCYGYLRSIQANLRRPLNASELMIAKVSGNGHEAEGGIAK